MYSIQALWSAVQLRLPVVFLILNNGRYAALQEFAPAFGFAADEPVQETDLPDLDFVAMASGMGCTGLRVAKARERAAVLAGALASHVPVIVDIQMA